VHERKENLIEKGEVSPVTELAWKLAISMIYTARVLHVFVTVIPVSEYLATVPTLVIQVRQHLATVFSSHR